MRNTSTLLAIATFCVLVVTAVRVGAQSVQPTSETYSWSGELVAFDESSRIATVKSRVVGEQALSELPQFKAGDRAVLTWSGFDTYADAILRAVRYDAGGKWNGPFTFPVEFVAYEPVRQYVTFKFQVPAGSTTALKTVKPGEWVTATARHRAASESEAITAVNGYTAVRTAFSSTN
jgi:hypothetical protein